MVRIATVVGARPQFIKAAPLSRELQGGAEEYIIHTGQHYDHGMDGVFFSELGIPRPYVNLSIGSGSHGEQTARMLEGIEKVVCDLRPDVILVYGDTNSTLAGALVGAKLTIPVAHVEAGLRSLDRTMPEEVNRVVTDHVSSLLFCPTGTAKHNLSKEGIEDGVHVTGDIMVDALEMFLPIAKDKSAILSSLDVTSKGYMLATVHRAGNTDSISNLKEIFEALASFDNVVLPCHPRTERILKEHDMWEGVSSSITLIPPVGYLDMLVLEENARLILTDSGGMQKEAYILGVPCITLRDTTEWTETIDDGWNVLVGTDTEAIRNAVHTFAPTHKRSNVFGEGNASKKIRDIILSAYDGGKDIINTRA